MKINSRHYILIIFALASMVVSIYGYFFVYKETVKQAENYIHTSKELEDEDNKERGEKELIRIYDSSKESRTKLMSFLVNENKVVDFIETVEGVGDDSGTKIELSAINKDTEKIKARVDAKGSWTGIMRALVLLENLPFSATIRNVRIDTLNDLGKGAHAWNLSLEIEVLTIK